MPSDRNFAMVLQMTHLKSTCMFYGHSCFLQCCTSRSQQNELTFRSGPHVRKDRRGASPSVAVALGEIQDLPSLFASLAAQLSAIMMIVAWPVQLKWPKKYNWEPSHIKHLRNGPRVNQAASQQ